ncbi:MAG: NAD(P)-dependent alcohol dehydrogenase [Sandaracinaceae bacterium]|nr:NAD(P)-dependent alcohol dehydrogenase [Sandaracinaceae bacterium]
MSALPQYGRHLHPTATMRAVLVDRYGPPEVLRPAVVPRPVPTRGQVLVRTRFIGVNPKDVIVRKGKFQVVTGKRFPLLVGHDIAGEVVEAGPGADLPVGTSVFGMINDFAGRAYAEYAAVDAQSLATAPASVDLRTAAAVPLAAQTALQGLRDEGRVAPGHHVLVNGASGGVGVFAVQIAKLLGAEVTAACSARNAELVRSLGADHVVDYATTPLPELATRFDCVFDVFGNYRFDTLRPLLTPGGTYVQTIPSGRIVRDIARTVLSAQRARLVVVRSHRAQLEWLRAHIDDGTLRVVVDRSFALDDAAEAHRYLETKRARGKVVLHVDG